MDPLAWSTFFAFSAYCKAMDLSRHGSLGGDDLPGTFIPDSSVLLQSFVFTAIYQRLLEFISYSLINKYAVACYGSGKVLAVRETKP